jgi:hypothetical protein
MCGLTKYGGELTKLRVEKTKKDSEIGTYTEGVTNGGL